MTAASTADSSNAFIGGHIGTATAKLPAADASRQFGLSLGGARNAQKTIHIKALQNSSEKQTPSGHTIVTSTDNNGGDANKDLVAFGDVETLCYEDEGEVVLNVVRRGTGREPISFEWETENKSVIENSYLHQEGKVVMAPNEMKTTFTIKILNNDTWNIEGTQLVNMKNTSENAVLGELCSATVVVLDEDTFPSNVKNMHDTVAVVYGFVKQLANAFPSELRYGMLMKVVPSLAWLMSQLLILVALDNAIPNKNEELIIILAVAFLVSVILLFSSADKFKALRLGGKSKQLLRWSILGTMLRLDPQNFDKFSTGEVINVMSSGVEKAVDSIWLNIFVLFESVCTTLAMLGLTIYIAFKGGVGQGANICVVFPFLMLFVDGFLMYCRAGHQAVLYGKFLNEDDAWKEKVVMYADLRQVIMTYRQGNTCGDIFKETHAESNKQAYAATYYQVQTDWMARGIHTVFTIAAFVIAGKMAIDHTIETGEFVALILTVFKFDVQMRAFFWAISDMANGYASVKKMSDLLNVRTRREALYKARKRRHELLSAHIAEDFPEGCGHSFDKNNISIVQAVAVYEGNEFTGQKKIGPVSMTIEPSQVISVTAGHNMGKNTFLKLIARMVLPSEGFVWYAENLRTRYISEKPMLFNRSLMFNLTFGNFQKHSEEDIWELCKRLGLSDELIGKGNMVVGNGGSMLSLSNRILICIARALLSSVDLLLLANTLDLLSDDQIEQIIKILHELVHNRGLPFLSNDVGTIPIQLRKRKTVFFITNKEKIERMATVSLRCDTSFLSAEDGALATAADVSIPIREEMGPLPLEPPAAMLEGMGPLPLEPPAAVVEPLPPIEINAPPAQKCSVKEDNIFGGGNRDAVPSMQAVYLPGSALPTQ